jgi:hypothetical protein
MSRPRRYVPPPFYPTFGLLDQFALPPGIVLEAGDSSMFRPEPTSAGLDLVDAWLDSRDACHELPDGSLPV